VSTEQEYDAQADTVDDRPESTGPGPYPAQLPSGQLGQQQGLSHQRQAVETTHAQGMSTGDNSQDCTSMTQLLDPYDPMLDMDPFGLSASMQFPTQFSFDTSSMR